MWWSETLHVGLSARSLQLAVRRRPWLAAASHDLPLPPAQGEPWGPAVEALARLLAEERGTRRTLRVVLGGRFARWQLLPWRKELSRPGELAAYAQFRFREVYGQIAEGWRVLVAPQPPGCCVPACAVDAALLDALQAAVPAPARLAAVVPYYAAAFDCWRGRLKNGSVWFGVAEEDCLTLGLLRASGWLGLRAQRLEGDWRETLPGLMAQIGIAAHVDPATPLFMAGAAMTAEQNAAAPFHWLAPASARAVPRLALGV